MKRRILLGTATVLFVCLVASLFRTAAAPENYTGAWYYAGNSALYEFEEGIIHCRDHGISLPGEGSFSGAYSFAGDRIAVFVINEDGPEEVRQLYLVHGADGDVLCENADGSGEVCFYRNPGALPAGEGIPQESTCVTSF